ncbi:MAG: hypothetical protein GXY55_20400 [Phycisphaerae bacterium]|nr:hypothetical protein [Phycisphaerae bacterium]
MDETQVPRKRRRRWLRFVVACGLFLLLLLVAGLIFDVIAGRELNRALAEAEKSGPVRFEDLEAQRAVWPPEANGALLVLAVSERLKDKLEPLSSDEVLPLVGKAKPGPVGELWSTETDQAVAQMIETIAPELAELDRLRDFQGGRFPLTVTSPLADFLLPHLSEARSCVRIKSLQALHDATHGRADTLPEHLAIMHTLGRMFEDEPTLISSMVWIACDTLAVSTVQQVLGMATLDPSGLARLDAELASMDAPDRTRWGLRGERAFFIDMVDCLRRTGQTGMEVNLPIRPLLPGLRGWLMHEQAFGVQQLNRIVAADNPRARLAVAREQVRELNALPAYYVFCRLLMPAFERSIEREMRITALIRAARVGVAVERYRIEHNAMPATLEALVPAYLDGIPADPFSEQPLRLTVHDDRLVIYSVGADLTDDGGDVSPQWGSHPEGGDAGFILLPAEQRPTKPRR